MANVRTSGTNRRNPVRPVFLFTFGILSCSIVSCTVISRRRWELAFLVKETASIFTTNLSMNSYSFNQFSTKETTFCRTTGNITYIFHICTCNNHLQSFQYCKSISHSDWLTRTKALFVLHVHQ